MIFEICADIVEREECRPGCKSFKNILILFLRMPGRAHQQKVLWQFSFALHCRFD